MPKFTTLFELLNSNPSEQDCIKYLERLIWKGKPTSPFDSTSKVHFCPSINQYKCQNTNKYFNVRTGTAFERSKLPLRKWFWALYLYSFSKKGISSCQLAKHISVSVTQKTAWLMLLRLRRSSNLSIFKEMLKDSVEIDETYVGGKNKNRHWDKKIPYSQGRSGKDKIPVLGMKEKHSNRIFAQVVPNVSKNTLEPIIKANVKAGATINTDEWTAYKDLGKWYNHQVVNHRTNQYTNKDASVNGMENFWSHFKKGISSTYYGISRKHAQGYVDEFTFRHNTRKYSEQEKFDLLLLSTVGKNMNYRELVS